LICRSLFITSLFSKSKSQKNMYLLSLLPVDPGFLKNGTVATQKKKHMTGGKNLMGLGDIHRAAKIKCDTSGVDAAFLLDHFYSNQKKTTDKTTHLPASAFWRSLRFITTQKIVFDTAPPFPLLPPTLHHSATQCKQHSATQCNTVQHSATHKIMSPPSTHNTPSFSNTTLPHLVNKIKTNHKSRSHFTIYTIHTTYMYIHVYTYVYIPIS